MNGYWIKRRGCKSSIHSESCLEMQNYYENIIILMYAAFLFVHQISDCNRAMSNYSRLYKFTHVTSPSATALHQSYGEKKMSIYIIIIVIVFDRCRFSGRYACDAARYRSRTRLPINHVTLYCTNSITTLNVMNDCTNLFLFRAARIVTEDLLYVSWFTSNARRIEQPDALRELENRSQDFRGEINARFWSSARHGRVLFRNLMGAVAVSTTNTSTRVNVISCSTTVRFSGRFREVQKVSWPTVNHYLLTIRLLKIFKCAEYRLNLILVEIGTSVITSIHQITPLVKLYSTLKHLYAGPYFEENHPQNEINVNENYE